MTPSGPAQAQRWSAPSLRQSTSHVIFPLNRPATPAPWLESSRAVLGTRHTWSRSRRCWAWLVRSPPREAVEQIAV
eukprot:scaffold523_cov237-Pinguiococcus_pyrenoidosus.AAC.2